MDWRKPAAVKWYTENVVGDHTATDPNFDGIFIDGPIASSQMCCDANLTLSSKQALFVGVAAMLKAVSELMAKHGKLTTASLGDHYSSLEDLGYYPSGTPPEICSTYAAPESMAACCAYGEEKFYEIIGEFLTNDLYSLIR